MKRIVFFILILIFIPMSMFSFDFGFALTSRTGVNWTQSQNESTAIAEQNAILSVWMKQIFGQYYTFYTSGNFEVDLRHDAAREAPLNPYYPKLKGNIDLLYFRGKVPITETKGVNYLGFDVGRFIASDSSGEILYTPIDGLALTLGFGDAELSCTMGYTGLQFRWASGVYVNYNDFMLEQKIVSEAASEYVQLAPPRFIADLKVKAPSLLKGHDIYFNFLAQADLWQYLNDSVPVTHDPVFVTTASSAMNTVYGGLGFSGSFKSTLFYNLYGYLGTGTFLDYRDSDGDGSSRYESNAIVSGMAGLDLEVFIQKALYSQLTFSFRFASGDSDYSSYFGDNGDGLNWQFTPITMRRKNIVFNPILSNLTTMELAYSFKPFSTLGNAYLDTFFINLSAKTFIRPTLGPISQDSNMIANNGQYYLGTEVDALINFINITDFGMYFMTGVFIPNASAFVTEWASPRIKAELNFSVRI